MSCDLLPTDRPGPHYQGDVRNILRGCWDLMIAHPPCTHLTVSCSQYWPEKWQDGRQAEAVSFFMELAHAPIPKICIENPVGIMSSLYRRPDQIIQPYEFGDDASKTTCLWLKGLLPLEIDPRQRAHGRMVQWQGAMVERWSNQTDSGQNRLSPSDDRWKLRSQTYPGIAQAMAEQWGAAAQRRLIA